METTLSERKKQILKTLVDDYIRTAQPVGSRTISRKHELGLSSATIRNEMADLEEMGYISQPHTSAGRVPSDKGYRFYVDHLMQVQALKMEEIRQIRDAIERKINEINTLIRRASDIISSITGYASVALSPSLSKASLKSVQVLPVDEKKLLIVIVTSAGVVKNHVIRVNNEIEINHDALTILTNYLQKKLNGLIIENIELPLINDVQTETGVSDEIIDPVMEGLKKCMQEADDTELIMNGITNLLNHPEFSDVIKVKELFELFNEQHTIKSLMSAAMKKGKINVQIGMENEHEVMRDCSVVTTVYNLGDTELGTLGIIGPTRMYYSRVFSAMNYLRNLINSEILRIINDE
ncbi:heat-inducible transcription repressor HrcA [Thermoclostridium stercorarium subsp. stercorarium DSM 8532]|uniref:Heat-inducible transcription repressor HrcA n=3 Tax=Thermoclostridium stercorarium TaxID=1510 RepID=L7VLE6_THES1|nr:heat-inducible transcriptional repressor HrcA [Thermoclostridium stercorarium]AGC69005.1 heat-inducible transcription repressor HrcA [Thermoclostridium stercorarium subsp. stercorarium DSM 8532]AGI39984.1 HrcA [Thermoclostridium stercorarium subsp. stercorarium DSM 8532]ANW99304.1 HrcA family transcriptional regulator [Thermoclostridium stercorarium subsp. thermolacticum DSM 2910]ANX01933.1 HrcA family transcriptional regulator [Thermoclostridium stercorarium subsp. leptospartum DSM 9219]UZ